MRGASRTLRRYPGGAVVSVRLRDRTYAQVVDDMIDGVLVANGVSADSIPRLRRAFQLALGETEIDLTAEELGAAYPGSPGPGGGTADAGGLNPPVPSGAYRFESCSGHADQVRPASSRIVAPIRDDQ